MKKMKNKKRLLIFLSSIITLFMITPCLAENNHLQNMDNQEKNLFLFPIHFYRKYVSSADGDRCPMHPSCSTYSLEAFKKHGLIKGWVMTCDRLMRCGRDELKLGQPVITREKTRVYDPVQNNDFWWNKVKKP